MAVEETPKGCTQTSSSLWAMRFSRNEIIAIIFDWMVLKLLRDDSVCDSQKHRSASSSLRASILSRVTSLMGQFAWVNGGPIVANPRGDFFNRFSRQADPAIPRWWPSGRPSATCVETPSVGRMSMWRAGVRAALVRPQWHEDVTTVGIASGYVSPSLHPPRRREDGTLAQAAPNRDAVLQQDAAVASFSGGA